MTDPNHPISFEKFQHLIAQVLQVDERQVVPEAAFVEDLYADSIRLVELLVTMEEQGVEIPFEEAWNIKTVGDAYRLYTAYEANRGSEVSVT